MFYEFLFLSGMQNSENYFFFILNVFFLFFSHFGHLKNNNRQRSDGTPLHCDWSTIESENKTHEKRNIIQLDKQENEQLK